ncbi:MAG TPA: hypothetical protein VFS00_14430 [Polyangiaceae bacterium]|nr:hypothetical protein [Polyangiaceae bacterium]
MTPGLAAVYDALLQRAAAGPLRPRADRLRERFRRRAGGFEPSHPKAEAREAAAWAGALAGGGLARELAETFEGGRERELAALVGRAQRGLFRLVAAPGGVYADEQWRGGAFVLLAADDVAQSARAAPPSGASFVGHVAAAADGCVCLPGLVWLPDEAAPHLDALLDEARRLGAPFDDVADALLRMDHALATLARVRPQYAFRLAALAPALHALATEGA